MPAMQKSIYVRKHFPETRREWQSSPTLLWLVDTLIPSLQHTHHLLLPEQNNFLFGISTGGRGAALCAEATGSLFRAAAMLSGDFDPLLDTHDQLMIGYLGTYERFPDRWSGADNPAASASALKIPIYLGHGANDRVVPMRQSIAFFKKLKLLHPDIHSILHIDTVGAHNYHYWESESKNILAFLLGHLALK
jgi:dipeptidyl aminopeptidase/acylaminoacyl peptidase